MYRLKSVKPKAKVHGSPTTGEIQGLPPVPLADTLTIEYIIHAARSVTETTANFPIHATDLIPYTANNPNNTAKIPAQNPVVPKIPGRTPLPVPALND